MKIVLAGGKGFIGRGLAARLLEDHMVAVWDFPEVNLLDSGSFSDELERFGPDLVVNLAGVLGGVQSKNIGQIFETNFCGNLNLVQQCVTRGVQRFAFASSLTVHGSNLPAEPCTLTSAFNPKHAYGASKAAAEYSLMQYAKQLGMVVAALRPTMVLGDTAVSHAPIDFIKTLLAGGHLELYGSGAHEREWLWIDDAVAGFTAAVNFCARAEKGYYPFFLSGNRIAMRDLAFKCAEHLGKDRQSVTFIDTREQAFTLTCDRAESERLLGWSPRWDLDAMIVELIEIAKRKRERA